MLTVAVSLALVGVALLLQPGRRQRHPAVEGRRRVHRLHEARRHRSDQIDAVERGARRATRRCKRSRVLRPAGGRTRSSSASSPTTRSIADSAHARTTCPTVVPGRPRTTQNAEVVDAARRRSSRRQPGVLRGRRRPPTTVERDRSSFVSDPRRLSRSPRSSLLVAAVAADLQHDPHGDVRPTARDRGDEARRRHQLVHPRPVHARGPGPGPRSAPCWRAGRVGRQHLLDVDRGRRRSRVDLQRSR